MSNPIYEVLFRGDANGKIVGRSVAFWENGQPGAPRSIGPDELTAIESTISGMIVSDNNALRETIATRDTALASKDAEKTAAIDAKNKELQDAAKLAADALAAKVAEANTQAAKVAELASHIDAIKSAVLDESTPTDAAVLAIVADATKDDTQKKRDVLTAQITDLQKQLESLG